MSLKNLVKTLLRAFFLFILNLPSEIKLFWRKLNFYWRALIIWSPILLLFKLLTDISKFRWTRSLFSLVDILNWWRDVPGPYDLWHMSDGGKLMIPAFFIIYLALKNSRWRWWENLMKVKRVSLINFVVWSWKNWVVYVLFCVAFWTIFYTAFDFFYHQGLMLPEWREEWFLRSVK